MLNEVFEELFISADEGKKLIAIHLDPSRISWLEAKLSLALNFLPDDVKKIF